jgi:hypothetical protein
MERKRMGRPLPPELCAPFYATLASHGRTRGSAILPLGWELERTALETGDLVLASHPHGATVERKTPGDLASCIGAGRERFERELRRSRYCGRFVVVVEGTLSDVAEAARGIHSNAVIGTLAAWTERYCPFIFAGSERLAANFTWRLLASQLPSSERPLRPREPSQTGKPPLKATSVSKAPAV